MATTFRVTPEDLVRGKVLKPGWYPATIKGFSEKAAKTDGSTNFVFEFTVDGPEDCQGVVLMRTFSEKAPGMMVPLLEAAGAKIDPKSTNTFDLDALVGRQIQVYNNNREYEGRIRNDVTDFRPL